MESQEDSLPSPVNRFLAQHRSPLRIHERYRIKASPQQVFGVLGDLEGITRFFPLIHHATVDAPADCIGEGSLRVCSVRGMGQVNEHIVWWNPPQGYAYRATGAMVPLRDHVGLIRLTHNSDGSTTVSWQQFFRTRFGPLGWVFPSMMRLLMARGIRNVARLLGVPSTRL